ncbi:hypothetical protein ACI65C_011660 [Semiaphis heraclei]
MPRTYVRKVGGRPYQNYNVESLDKALNAILKTNISIRQAAEQFQEIDERRNGTVVPSNEAYELATSMMYSEWMLEVPEDIDSWIAVLCPEGKRCCVIAQDNKTKTVNKFGTTLNYYSSLFPYGCRASNNCPSHRKRTVLDCVYSFKLKKYYILDIIEWMGVPYTDFDAEFRFYFIQSKLSEIPGINEKSTTNFYPFELAPRMVTRDLYHHILEKGQFFPNDIELDGINFYYPESLYTPAPLSNLNPIYTGRNVRDADTIRKQFTNRFMNEGKLEWQDKMV